MGEPAWEKGDNLFKLVVVGDHCVGKTSLVSRFLLGNFSRSYTYTRGGDVLRKELVINDRRVCVTIIDTMGQVDFKSMIKSVYRGAHGIMVVYDVTREKSFLAVTDWMDHIKKHIETEPQFLIVGNKRDLTAYRRVDIQEAEHKAATLEVPHYEVSALRNENVEEAFNELIKLIWMWFSKSGRKVMDVAGIRLAEVPHTEDSCCS